MRARLSWIRGVTLAAAWLALGACGQNEPAPVSKQGMHAVVSIAPLKSLVAALLPEGSTVEMLIPAGVSEHGYEIPPTKLAAISGADLVVYVGLGLEPQLEKLLREHPRAGRIDFEFAEAVGIRDEHAAAEAKHDGRDGRDGRDGHDGHEGQDGGDGGDAHDHPHGEHDPHLWLDPVLIKVMVGKLDARLHKGAKDDATPPLSAAAMALLAKVDAMDTRYRAMIEVAPRKAFIVGHNAWDRLADRYGLTTIPIAGLNASEPKPSDIAAAASAAREKGITTVFVEPQLNQAVARRIAANSQLKVEVLDPLGDGDWAQMMSANLEKIGAALGAEPGKK